MAENPSITNPSVLLERVARAIAPKAWKTLGLPPGFDRPSDQYRRAASLRHARAAIEAMREPTEEMAEAGADKASHCDLPVGAIAMQVGWQAMIDAALTKPEGE